MRALNEQNVDVSEFLNPNVQGSFQQREGWTNAATLHRQLRRYRKAIPRKSLQKYLNAGYVIAACRTGGTVASGHIAIVADQYHVIQAGSVNGRLPLGQAFRGNSDIFFYLVQKHCEPVVSEDGHSINISNVPECDQGDSRSQLQIGMAAISLLAGSLLLCGLLKGEKIN
jgi:hypothetical protein